jgi:hypothetical protein
MVLLLNLPLNLPPYLRPYLRQSHVLLHPMDELVWDAPKPNASASIDRMDQAARGKADFLHRLCALGSFQSPAMSDTPY